MAPPPAKLARLIATTKALSSKQVQETVAQALISDDKACATLFATLKGNASEKDIADAVLAAVKVLGRKVTLVAETINPLNDYLSMLAVQSCCAKFKELSDVVKELAAVEEKGHTCRNVVFMLVHFLEVANILAYEKFLQLALSELPTLVVLLLENQRIEEACYLARCLMHLLLAVKSYMDEEQNYDAVWDAVINEATQKNVQFALMSTLLVDAPPKWTKKALTVAAIGELSRSDDADMSLSNQFITVFAQHMPSFYATLNPTQFSASLVYVLKTKAAENKLNVFLRDTHAAAHFVGDHCSVWRVVLESLLKLLQEDIEANEDTKIAPWIGAVADLFSCADDEVEKTITTLMRNFDEHSKLRKYLMKEIPVSNIGSQVLSALPAIPWDLLDTQSERNAKLALLVLGVFCQQSPTHLAAILDASVTLWKRESNGGGLVVSYKFFTLLLDAIVPSESAADEVAQRRVVSSIELLASVARSMLTGSNSDGFWQSVRGIEDGNVSARLYRSSSICRAASGTSSFASSNEILSSHLEVLIAPSLADETSAFDRGVAYSALNEIVMLQTTGSDVLAELVDKKRRKKLCKTAFAMLSDSGDETKEYVRFLLHAHRLNVKDSNGKDTLKNVEKLLKACASDRSFVIQIVRNWSPEEKIGLLTTLASEVSLRPDEVTMADGDDEDNETKKERGLVDSAVAIAADVLPLIDIGKHADELKGPLASLIEACSGNVAVIELAAVALETLGSERQVKQTQLAPLVSLCLAAVATPPLECNDVAALKQMETFLVNCLRFTAAVVNNDQCALYGYLVLNHFKNIERLAKAVQTKTTVTVAGERDIESLAYGAARIAHQFSTSDHSKYYSRVVPCVISQTLLNSTPIELALIRLHKAVDQHGSSFLAASLPPVEKKIYGRIFTDVKKSKEKVV